MSLKTRLNKSGKGYSDRQPWHFRWLHSLKSLHLRCISQTYHKFRARALLSWLLLIEDWLAVFSLSRVWFHLSHCPTFHALWIFPIILKVGNSYLLGSGVIVLWAALERGGFSTAFKLARFPPRDALGLGSGAMCLLAGLVTAAVYAARPWRSAPVILRMWSWNACA